MVSQHDALIAVLKIQGTLTRNIYVGVGFNIVIGDTLDSSNCLKRTLRKKFFWESFEIFKKIDSVIDLF